jgi:hypothetical protein
MRLARVAAATFWVVLAGAAPGAAQSRIEIEPERPAVTERTLTVPRGYIQLETGVEYSQESEAGRPDTRELALQAALRVGVTERLEVRLAGFPIVSRDGPAEEEDTGVGDFIIGMKYRFLDRGDEQPSLAILPFIKIPTADEPIGTGRPDFGLILAAGFVLPADLKVDASTGAVIVGESDGSLLVQALLSGVISYEIANGLTVFAELVYLSRGETGGRSLVASNTGLVYKLTERIALDAAIQASLAGKGPDYVVRTGASVLFGW